MELLLLFLDGSPLSGLQQLCSQDVRHGGRLSVLAGTRLLRESAT